MEFLKRGLDKVLGIFCIILFAFLVLLVTWQVITRFVFNEPSVFSEELAKYCFVWLVLFGSAYVFGENGHMSIEFIREKFPDKLKMAVEVFIELVIIAFAALILIKGGYAVTELAWTQLSASLQIPVGYLYAAMPTSGVCIIFYCIYNISLIFQKKKPLEEIQL
ncbi:TRAP-type C4-dicarboxylate transport system permease small subunit [Planomicrobium soli]|uniref:TRAP-type C4-dicarboxylate transport system permease small subunit n=1 Tax=Planomicrobium soli TaxID=1176648 RepID=A0A2P8H1V8_9BACL|nr:TRAP transporter small permease [Planomicrobium soli]PSL40180.1 TRAP-type C4-dicarboxylate transport system permease small subunit [Planomicrobium soli]